MMFTVFSIFKPSPVPLFEPGFNMSIEVRGQMSKFTLVEKEILK